MAQVSIMVPSPTRAPTLTKLGISTAPLAMKAERRTTAPGTARKPAARKLRFVPAQEFGIDLVPPHRFAGRAGDDLHVVEAEGQQHGLLQPLMHLPFAADLLGDAQRAVVQAFQRGFHGVALRAFAGDAQAGRASPRRRSMAAPNHSWSNPDAVQKLGKIVGFMVDMPRPTQPEIPGPAGPRRASVFSQTVVMPMACGRHQIAGDIVEHRGCAAVHSRHAPPRWHRRAAPAWAQSPWCGCPRSRRTDAPCPAGPGCARHGRGSHW